MKHVVIAACGDSNRSARHITKLFCGEPMLKWSIDDALQRAKLSKVLPSTAQVGLTQANNVDQTAGQKKGVSAWN